MSQTSNWPLPDSSIRFLVPKPIIAELSLNVMTKDLYPLAFGHYFRASGHRAQRSQHKDHLLILCLQGQGHVQYKNHQQKVSAGQALLLPKGLAHSYQADTHDPWSLYWVHLDGHLAEQYINVLAPSQSGLVFDISNKILVLTEFEQLLECRHSTYQFNNFILASNILRKLLGYLITHEQQNNWHDHSFINMQIIDGFLEKHLAQQVSLEEMAQASGLSKFHFAKKFQKQTGISPVRYFLELKIKHACELIDRTQLPIKQISSQLGYDDPYYFSRLFKKIMGLSPKQYRQIK